MSRRAIKSINWAALLERLPESEKNVYVTFRAKSDQYLRRMTANPESPPKIDWSYYKRTITTPGLVDKFQKEYEALSIPYPADKYTADIESEEKETLKQIDNFVQEANQMIENAKIEIEKIQQLLPYSEMTLEDFRDIHPEEAINPDKPTAWPHTPEVQASMDAGDPKKAN
ncbi:PREDICTED: ATP synthase subunit d, mitochondrial-like [Dufourea novaeangliae]|uniref:ATP synthase subunit d, mitochondrial n=1 Tax=Dufourea novaeangliae TaxID=178035 RepID=A0A154PPS5_DUFNO|nr:PREDICTED: ATP synthase subunit d, mitochondrial-like [Dufourea novaeangliae]KZC13747.1 ATP synthase subunit d, mitochondrial [Dufourea novaeangliae]